MHLNSPLILSFYRKHLYQAVQVVLMKPNVFSWTVILSLPKLTTYNKTDQWTRKPCDKIKESAWVLIWILLSPFILWMTMKEYVEGFVWQNQYNQLNSPGILELIESVKTDYLSTQNTKEMAREKLDNYCHGRAQTESIKHGGKKE